MEIGAETTEAHCDFEVGIYASSESAYRFSRFRKMRYSRRPKFYKPHGECLDPGLHGVKEIRPRKMSSRERSDRMRIISGDQT